MHRLIKFLCLSTSLVFLLLPASYAEVESGLVPTLISPERMDSLRNTKEPTLQEILDGLGYDIDVVNDKLPTEVWEVIAGQYTQVILEELGGAPDQIISGWYVAGSRYDTTIIFMGPNSPPDSTWFYITGCDSNGLFIVPYAEGEGCNYIYYTEQRLNPDNKDHAWVFCSKKRPNEFIVAWEDELFLGDQDYNDLILLYRMPNRPPVLEVPNDTTYSVCIPDTIYFNVSAYDPDYCGDTVIISKILGPGIYEAGSCCFLPASVDSAYTFVFVATDWFGAQDTDTVVITVEASEPPELTCPDDDSVHAGELFVSTDFSVSDLKAGPVTVALCGVTPTPTNQPSIVEDHVEWQTDCADDGIFTICLEVTDSCGAKDTCYFDVTVYNQPPVLTCPEDDSVHVGDTLISTNFSVSDPEDDPTTVDFLDIDPSATNDPTIVDNHAEWVTTCEEDGDYTIRLVATDSCGAEDTCEFTVTVYNQPPEITCPDDDSVHAGDTFVSTDFSVSDPEGDTTTVEFLDINPSATNDPIIVDNHVEWVTTCEEDGDYTIRLVATDSCGAEDTCEFTVIVYNQPPEITCPEDDTVYASHTFVSTDFSVSDPEDDTTTVEILDIDPSATNTPTIVENHVEWVTTFSENGDYIIRLVATDSCGLADTCEFKVTVLNEITGDFTCPDDDSVHAGDTLISTNFSVTYPLCDPSMVEFLDINPPATNNPTIVDYHVEWVTTCAEDGDYVIRLITGEDCWVPDTCEFTVTVYNRPPELICPDYGIACPNRWFFSTDFLTTDPDGDIVQVSILDIDPPDTNNPVIVGNHVEWLVTCEELGERYVIRLVATDPCGLADTCEFTVDIYCQPPPDFTLSVDPDTQYVVVGHGVGYAVKLTSLLGFANPCTLFVSGLPNPPDNGVFDQATLVPTNSTTLNVYTATETDTGWYDLIVTAKEKSGPIQHTVQVHLKVQIASDVEDWADNPNTPEGFTLFQNQPNPFNPETEIRYHLPQACQVRLTIYNILGQRVKTLLDGYQNAGAHTLLWDGRDEDGVQLSSGIYFYRLRADDFLETKKMTLMK